jgi:hypothetical protein
MHTASYRYDQGVIGGKLSRGFDPSCLLIHLSLLCVANFFWREGWTLSFLLRWKLMVFERKKQLEEMATYPLCIHTYFHTLHLAKTMTF